MSAEKDPVEVVLLVAVDSIDGHTAMEDDSPQEEVVDKDEVEGGQQEGIQQVQMNVRGARRTRKQRRPSKVDEDRDDVVSRCITSALHTDKHQPNV